ncbi:nucleoside 2-deoxyribosyltransferase [Myxococcus fulvus]|uniref:nucleoside 2-deoxyribosyltransferase n=1 Tax=Myxococcus fulvus TaxID=33 RepID=UPI003B9D4205
MTTPQSAVFLGGPFKSLVSPETGVMREQDQDRFMQLIHGLEGRGLRVFNAHRRESWGREFLAPEECTRLDFEEIRSSDAFIAFPGAPASPGTHVEIGWASALRKPLILFLEGGKEYAFLVRGLHAVGNVRYLHYVPGEDLMRRLTPELERLGL